MTQEAYDYVIQRYEEAISYYWKAAAANKRAYKWTRYLTIVFGALVTLVAALASAEFVQQDATYKMAFAIGTPALAFILTVLGGVMQNFQWGASWREMVITSELLQTECDRIRVTKSDELDATKDLETLNELILTESQGFFDRILGRTQVKTPTG